jgi:hypothetical protein
MVVCGKKSGEVWVLVRGSHVFAWLYDEQCRMLLPRLICGRQTNGILYRNIKVSKYKSTKCRILEAFLSTPCIYYRLSLSPYIYRTIFASQPLSLICAWNVRLHRVRAPIRLGTLCRFSGSSHVGNNVSVSHPSQHLIFPILSPYLNCHSPRHIKL